MKEPLRLAQRLLSPPKCEILGRFDYPRLQPLFHGSSVPRLVRNSAPMSEQSGKVLLLEHEAETANAIADRLAAQGFYVEIVSEVDPVLDGDIGREFDRLVRVFRTIGRCDDRLDHGLLPFGGWFFENSSPSDSRFRSKKRNQTHGILLIT